MKKFISINILLSFFSVASAYDYCENFLEAPIITRTTFKSLNRQHRIVEHASMGSLNSMAYLNLMSQFYKELCKMPYKHRKIISLRRLETHLTAGPITQHPFISALPMGPRDHDTGWDVVPGAAAVARDAPTVINIQSLYRGHGSKNLVLHELAHVLDRFYSGYEIYNFDLSPADEFLPIYKDTPWVQVYGEFLVPYHRNNIEEHFAELYAKWYHSDNSRAEIRALIPGIEEYFNSLL